MDRRESIKSIIIGGLTISALAEACNAPDKKGAATDHPNVLARRTFDFNRMPEELEHFNRIKDLIFFNEAEMATITILADIIIPRDNVSGSATDAQVPEFFQFIVNDMPEHQAPLRDGIKWLDDQCMNRYKRPFKDCRGYEQMEIVDLIAWPDRVKDKPKLAPGVAFFNLMRNLTATAFYTTEIGVKDIGYIGNTPNQWNGVPDDVLAHYKLAYSERELKECAHYS
ncbi:MAG: transcriptional initiation protein Tat [Bacteroidetes bacterium]|nr:MAG: transcriptional initiation protein Tat [Bacteroidota bacterium]